MSIVAYDLRGIESLNDLPKATQYNMPKTESRKPVPGF